MAEIGLVASLLGISSFGVQLSTSLYKFGSTVSSARDQTDYVARHVTLYSDVLGLLAQRIDDDEPIHSRKALNLVDEIYDQSYDLFEKIEDLLPDPRDKVSLMQKIKWNFKKIKVDLLVAEIEYLKSTVNLLVSVLYAGKKIRSYRRKKRSKKAEKEVNVQFARAQNAVVEQLNACTEKESLRVKVQRDEQAALEDPRVTTNEQGSSALIAQPPQVAQLANNTAMVRFTQSLAQAHTASEERNLVIQNSINLVQELLDQWTTLADHGTDADPGSANARPSSEAPFTWHGNVGNDPAELERMPYRGPSQGPATTKEADSLSEMYLLSQNKVKALEAELERLKAAANRSTVREADHLQTRSPMNLKQPTVADDVEPAIPTMQREGKNRRSTGVAFYTPVSPVVAAATPAASGAAPPKGILKSPRESFPEDPFPPREGIWPSKDTSNSGIPPNARWTKISRVLVNPEALEKANERFEERDEYVIVLRLLTKEEIMKLAGDTKEIREARVREWDALEEVRRAKAEKERISSGEGTEQPTDSRQPSRYAGGSGEKTFLYGDQSRRFPTDRNAPTDGGPFGRSSIRREGIPRSRSVSPRTASWDDSSGSDEEALPKHSMPKVSSRTMHPEKGPSEDILAVGQGIGQGVYKSWKANQVGGERKR